MPYQTKTLGWALKQVNPVNSSFFIPAMQRPFVWERSDLVKLFESIYKGYPIGTSLVWPTVYNNPNNLGAARAYWVPNEFVKDAPARQAQITNGTQITLVLDGQQRLTSLNIGINGGWYENQNKLQLCFNPSAINDSPFKFLNLAEDDIEHNILCKYIMNWESEQELNNWLNHTYLPGHGNNQNLRPERVEQNIRNLRNGFWNTEAYCFGVHPAENIREALDVFQLANDTGKRLDKTDLIIATLQIAWDACSPREAVQELVQSLNRQFNGNNPFDRKKLFNLFIQTSNCGIPASYSLGDFDGQKVRDLEEHWPIFVISINALVEQLNRWGLTKSSCLNSINTLIPVLLWQNTKKINYMIEDNSKLAEIEKARCWLIIAMLTASFSGQSTTTISLARRVIESTDDDTFPKKDLLIKLEDQHNYDFITRQGVEHFVCETKYGDKRRVRLLLMLLKKNLKSDFIYQIDHIFPLANNRNRFPQEVNLVSNLQLLTPQENREKNNHTPAILWNNTDVFDDNFRDGNLLPIVNENINYMALWDAPERLWETRKNTILNMLYQILEI
jgi:hypothetical protein